MIHKYIVPPQDLLIGKLRTLFNKHCSIHGEGLQEIYKKRYKIPKQDEWNRTIFVRYNPKAESLYNGRGNYTWGYATLNELLEIFERNNPSFPYLGMHSSDVRDGKEIITTPLTLFDFMAYVHVVKQNGKTVSNNDWNEVAIIEGEPKCMFLYYIKDENVIAYNFKEYGQYCELLKQTIFVRKIVFTSKDDKDYFINNANIQYASVEINQTAYSYGCEGDDILG